MVKNTLNLEESRKTI